MQYYKVLNDKMNHHRFQYKLGLNIDTSVFNDEECENGLHFCRKEDVPEWLSFGTKLAFVSIPETAKVCHFQNKNKSKADSIFIEKIIDLKDWNEWENENFCLEAVKKNRCSLLFVKNQTEKICLEAVKRDGYSLVNVKKQTEKICLEAVRTCGLALKFVKNQTEEICFEAVKCNSYALQFVKNQTEEICLEAIKENGYILKYVENQTEKILEVAKKNPSALKYIRK